MLAIYNIVYKKIGKFFMYKNLHNNQLILVGKKSPLRQAVQLSNENR